MAGPRTGLTSKLECSRHFTDWLAEQQISLAFTTYQSGKLFLVGRRPNGQPSVFERTFERSMGLWSDGQTIWLTSQFQIWRLANVLVPDQTLDGFDRLYVPRRATSPVTLMRTISQSRRMAVRCLSTRCSVAWRRLATGTTSSRHGGRRLSAGWRPRIVAI